MLIKLLIACAESPNGALSVTYVSERTQANNASTGSIQMDWQAVEQPPKAPEIAMIGNVAPKNSKKGQRTATVLATTDARSIRGTFSGARMAAEWTIHFL